MKSLIAILLTGFALSNGNADPVEVQNLYNVMSTIETESSVYYITCDEDYEEMFNRIESNGDGMTTVVEISDATLNDSNGNATDTCGYYRNVGRGIGDEGDIVRSIYIYNANSTYTDDVIYQYSFLLEDVSESASERAN